MRFSTAIFLIASAVDMASAQTPSPTQGPTGSPTQGPTGSPSKAPTQGPTSSPSKAPTGSPTKAPTQGPTGSPSKAPTQGPTSSPTKGPTGSPTKAPTQGPTTSPTKAPTQGPTTSPTKAPTTSPTSQPSGQPSQAPSERPSSIPSEAPSGQPSSAPSEQPSSIPSAAPSGQPSSIPSGQPSSQPSEQPTSQPSGQPSAQPSCTPSMAPTDPATVFLFYPDWTPGSSGCANDGEEPTYMRNNPGNYLHSTLDSCCKAYFGFNYAGCMGSLPGICARSLFYPDWEGSNQGCVSDGNEPVYMTNNAMNYLYSQLEDCCATHYNWNYDSCVGSFGAVYSDKYYPDWEGEDNGCSTGGGQPQYMSDAPDAWLHDTLEECCSANYQWNYAECMGTDATASASTGQFYPDWDSTDHICKQDGGEPDYMRASPNQWMYDSQKECCEKHYSWNYDTCMGSDTSSNTATPATSAATGKFYMSWTARKCRQDCEAGSGICGGVASAWNFLYDSLDECCDKANWWNDDCEDP